MADYVNCKWTESEGEDISSDNKDRIIILKCLLVCVSHLQALVVQGKPYMMLAN